MDITFVSSSYFDTIHQPIVSGRSFTEHDDVNAPLLAVVNQTMANHRWPNEDPVGRRVSFDRGKTWVKIAGVAGDVKEYGLDRKVLDEIYLSTDQDTRGNGGRVVVRTSADPMSVAAAVRAVLHQIDPQLAVDRVNTIERLRYDSIASPRVTAILLGLFAVLAVIISGCGIAASLALSVRQRTSELGVRMALGASRESIVWMVVRQRLDLGRRGRGNRHGRRDRPDAPARSRAVFDQPDRRRHVRRSDRAVPGYRRHRLFDSRAPGDVDRPSDRVTAGITNFFVAHVSTCRVATPGDACSVADDVCGCERGSPTPSRARQQATLTVS